MNIFQFLLTTIFFQPLKNKTTTNEGLFENHCISLKNKCLVANINPLIKMKYLN